jgi:hypothetical protein
MQVTAATPLREHERPMSWARAVLIAVGFFFLTAILTGQIPAYFFTISTLSTLARFQQGCLDLGLLAVGFGLIAFEIAFLYDPKPLIPWPLFAAVGAAFSVVGFYMVWQVWVGIGNFNPLTGQAGWGEFLVTPPGPGNPGYWPNPNQSYLFHPAWFQIGSIDLSSIGMIALLVGLGMLVVALLNPFALRGRLAGPLHSLLVRFSLGLSIVIAALYLTVQTFAGPVRGNPFFAPQGAAITAPVTVNGQKVLQTHAGIVPSAASNVLLFLALCLAMFALILWLLPVMVANRQRFMPAVYLHGVVGLLGNIGIPLLVIWVITYPVVNLIHGADPDQVWVQCALKNAVPSSCTFTPFTGYILCAIVFSLTFGLLMAGLYFWSTRRDMVVLGGTMGLVFMAIAATIIHVDDPNQVPMGLIIAISIAVLAFAWVWGTQREFSTTQAQPLGCVGQWMVLGTLLLVYLFGFALFSMPAFFETEALALFYQAGRGGLHDAFWALLLMGGLAALQFIFLVQRRKMSNLRKFAMWVMLVAVLLMMIGAIQGINRDVLQGGVNALEGSSAIFLTGICFEIVGVLVALYGAWRARGIFSFWTIAIIVMALIGVALGVVVYNFQQPYPELVAFAFMLAMAGALAYTAAGPDEFPPETDEEIEASFATR